MMAATEPLYAVRELGSQSLGPNVVLFSPETLPELLDVSRPVEICAAEPSQTDETFADLGETFVLRQFDEEGTCHTIVLSTDMVIQVAKLMKAWVSLG